MVAVQPSTSSKSFLQTAKMGHAKKKKKGAQQYMIAYWLDKNTLLGRTATYTV